MGTREEDDCEIVEAAVFQRYGNEQRCQIQHLANGEETAEKTVLARGCEMVELNIGTEGVNTITIGSLRSELRMHTTQSFEGAALGEQG